MHCERRRGPMGYTSVDPRTLAVYSVNTVALCGSKPSIRRRIFAFRRRHPPMKEPTTQIVSARIDCGMVAQLDAAPAAQEPTATDS